jgi:hypothetical protein
MLAQPGTSIPCLLWHSWTALSEHAALPAHVRNGESEVRERNATNSS